MATPPPKRLRPRGVTARSEDDAGDAEQLPSTPPTRMASVDTRSCVSFRPGVSPISRGRGQLAARALFTKNSSIIIRLPMRDSMKVPVLSSASLSLQDARNVSHVYQDESNLQHSYQDGLHCPSDTHYRFDLSSTTVHLNCLLHPLSPYICMNTHTPIRFVTTN